MRKPIALLACIGALLLTACRKVDDPDQALDQKFAEYLLGEVRDRLTDPGSAQFRDVQHYGETFVAKDGTRDRMGLHVVCGNVNAKDKLGGYGGYRGFVAAVSWDAETFAFRPGSLVVILASNGSDRPSRGFEDDRKRLCRDQVVRE
jgi:hypothetical protein